MSTLSDETIEIVSATVPALEQHGEAIVARMYERLLADASIRAFFNMSHQTGDSAQHKALTGAILAYARHIREPQVLAATIERIAQKHVALKIEPEHYEAVANALLAAISDVLAQAATDDVLNAWGEAYWFLANVLIDREKRLYQDQTDSPGSWSGWRKFVITDKHAETAEIMSFTLRPEDGQPVLKHKPGQYLSFLIDTGAADGTTARRTYSISSAPNGTDYRITVKHETHGKVSGWLHNAAQVGTVLDVGAPAGEFFLDPASKSEIVLLSGGVGLTPMISMLEANAGGALPITFVHATRSQSHHAMKEISHRLATTSANFYEEPEPSQKADEPSYLKGRVDASWLATNTRPESADYYICGPSGFMKTTVSGLRSLGVTDDRLHYEFFGPATEAL